MSIFVIILLCLFIISLLFILDYRLGRKKHLTLVKKTDFPKRSSHLTLYTSGPELFEKMFQDIRNASHHIHIEFYIVKNDGISKRFTSLLKKKATEGVEVRLLLDRLGSLTIKKKTISDLKNAGVKFSFSQTPTFPYFFYSTQERNHRKITVIDGAIGYIGGFNIGKEYENGDPKLGPWRDYHLRVTGEGIQDLEAVFMSDWIKANGEHIQYKSIYENMNQTGPYSHQFKPTEGAFLEEAYVSLITKANQQIIIGTPYFIPSKTIMNALLSALHNGISLHIVVPNESDHLLVKEASFSYFRELLKAGAKIYQFQNGFFHAKYVLIDEAILDIGTANFDKRSLFLNHEINCFIYDSRCIHLFKKEMEQDIQNSTPLSLQDLSTVSLWVKIKEGVAHIMSPFL